MIALATAAMAAKSARGSVSSQRRLAHAQPACRTCGVSPVQIACCSSNSCARIRASVSSGCTADQRAKRVAVPIVASDRILLQRRSAKHARQPRRTADRSSSTSDCSGVAVTSRFAVQTSRDTASKVIMDGGGEVRRQNV